MTNEEKIDLEEMQKECNDICKSAFSAMRDILRYSPQELGHTGYKTVEAALIGTFKYYQEKCDTRMKEHLKKYPDSK